MECHVHIGHSLIVLSKRLREIFMVKAVFRVVLRKHHGILWVPYYSAYQCFMLVLPENEGMVPNAHSTRVGIKSYLLSRGL